MEEAVVEALVIVALISIATIIGSYMTYASILQARAIQERNAKILALDIATELTKACKLLYRQDKPEQYTSTTITISLSKRETVRLEAWGIVISPNTKARTALTLSELESLCSRAAGTTVNINIVPDVIVGDVIHLYVEANGNTITIRKG